MGVNSRPAHERNPAVIIDDVHVVFREYANGERPAEPRRLFSKPPTARKTRKIHALRGVSFTVYEGESIAVLGRNGSGKSTLMSVIAGLLPPTSGAVYAQSNPTHLGINAAFMGDLTGTQNVVLGGLALGLDHRQIAQRYDQIVEFSGIGDSVDLPMRTYSSGMGARLRFSIATTVAHQILIIDEALSVGDEEFNRKSRQRIDELRATAGTVFLVSHSLQQVKETCTRAVWLEAGVVVADGDVEFVTEAYRLVQNGLEDVASALARVANADLSEAMSRYQMARAIPYNESKRAATLLAEAIALHPNPPPWWFFEAGEHAIALHDYQLARKYFIDGIRRKVAMNDSTNLSNRHDQLAIVCDKLGLAEEASSARVRALSLEAESAS